MTNPLNSPTPSKSNSLIPTRPTTPTNLWNRTPIKNRPPSPVFDEKILPSHWSSNTRQVIKKTMEDLLKLKKILETAIQSLKYSLPALHLPREQTNELIKALMMAAEQFKNIQDSAHPLRQILEERRPICHRSFDHLRTVDEVSDRITYLTSISGICVTQPEKRRLAKLWILLQDDRFVLALISQA